VEEGALTLGGEALLADESWFSAVGVDADHAASVSINAVGAVLDGLAHSQKNIKNYMKCGHSL
jgi:hypothetical protein